MIRTAMDDLIKWKDSKHRIPLIIRGAPGREDVADEGVRRTAYPDTVPPTS